MMSSESKNHHYVPQALLKRFVVDGRLWQFDKKTGYTTRESARNACSEEYFNKISLDDCEYNFEFIFNDVDNRSAPLVAKIIKQRSLNWLTHGDLITLADMFYVQMIRTKLTRTSISNVAERLQKLEQELGHDPHLQPEIALSSDAQLKLSTIELFRDHESSRNALLRLVPCLYETQGDERFILSDHPVCCINAFPYGSNGLTSPGILVLLPIAPTLMIALHCPTIVQRYKGFEQAEMTHDRMERMRLYRDGLLSGLPVAIDSDTAQSHNQRQVMQSHRFLYSSKNDFKLAREMISEHPELSLVESHLKVGELGQGLPRRTTMPAGLYLVIFGAHDHGMLAIEEVDEAGEGFTARTLQIELLSQIAADAGILRAEIYLNGKMKEMHGQAKIECFGEPITGWFRVVDHDLSMRRLSYKLDIERRQKH